MLRQNIESRTMTEPALLDALQTIRITVLEKLFDRNPDVAFFIKDKAGQYVVVNDSLVTRHGLKRKSDALGKRPEDICRGEFGSLPTEQDAAVIRSGKPLLDYLELQWYRPGTAVWCLTSKLPLQDDNGNVVGLIGFSRDLRAPVATTEIPLGFATALADFERDPSQNFSPAVLATRSGLSHARLARLTKKFFSLTPSQLLAKTRVTVASRLLSETSLTILEIAQRCGYTDQSAFTRGFQKLTRVAPTEYRRRESGTSPNR